MKRQDLRQKTIEVVTKNLIAVYRFRRSPTGEYYFDYLNAGARKLLNVPEDMDYQTDLHTFPRIPEDELEAFLQSVERSAETLKPWNYVFPYLFEENDLRYYRAQSVPEKLEDGTVIWHGYFTDATAEAEQSHELEEAQTQLRRQTEFLEESQEVARLGSWEVPAETMKPNWSRETYWLHGCDPDSDEAANDVAEGVSFYVPEHQETISRAVQQAFLDGTPFDLELQIIPRDSGSRKWVRVIGHAELREDEVTRLYGIFQDIDHQRRSEEALRESQQRLDLAVRGGQLGLWDYNMVTGKGFVNERWRELLGFADRNLKPDIDYWKNRLHPDDRERVLAAFQDHLEGRSRFFTAEYRLKQTEDRWIWVTDSGQVTKRTDNGKPLRVTGMMLDITAAKMVEEHLRESKELAEAANRSKDEFLAMMSHELRTPLNGILGFAEILRNTELQPDQLEFVQMIRSSGAQLVDIITDILDFSRLQARKLDVRIDEFLLDKAITSAVNTLQPLAESKNVKLELNIADNVPQRVRQDGDRVKQIINNLVSNAVKFTDEGGVTVNVRLDSSREIHNWLVIEVSDTGAGIPEEKQKHLFEPFVQVDSSLTRRHGGTGLGLSIVKKLCDLLNGSVTFKSREGKGSTFTVRLPIEFNPDATRHTPRETTPMPKSLADRFPLNILVVEDDKINARLIAVLLKRLEYTPTFAANGRKALEKMNQHRFDLVLMDVQMPQMDGYDTTRAIREGKAGEEHKEVAIVGLTALTMPQDHEKCLSAGMNTCLTKPLRSQTLVRVLQKVAEGALDEDD